MTFTEYSIYESFKSKKAETKISHCIGPFIEHLYKYWYCEDRRPQEHWYAEIVNFLNLAEDAALSTKSKKGRLSLERMQNAFRPFYEKTRLLNKFKGLKRRYPFSNFDFEESTKNIEEFFEKLWVKFDKNKYDVDEFLDFIENLRKI